MVEGNGTLYTTAECRLRPWNPAIPLLDKNPRDLPPGKDAHCSCCLWKLSSVVLVAQSCPALCNPMGYGPPGSSVHGILQARILEWVAIPFSSGFSQPGDQIWVSCTAGRFFTVWAREGDGCPSLGADVQNKMKALYRTIMQKFKTMK